MRGLFGWMWPDLFYSSFFLKCSNGLYYQKCSNGLIPQKKCSNGLHLTIYQIEHVKYARFLHYIVAGHGTLEY